MYVLALGLVLMLGVHVFATLRGPRGRVVERIGADPYRGLHSLVAAAGLALIVWASAAIAPTTGTRSGRRRSGRAM